MKSVVLSLLLAAGALVSCSSAQKQAAGDSVTQLNAACAKVRELNKELEALNLDEKGLEALEDPKTKKLLDDASQAASELATELEAKSQESTGKLGELVRKYDENKELIGEVADFAADESKDSMKDKVRRLKRVADLVGADNCAGTNEE
jgi:signal transduction histidine kinase